MKQRTHLPLHASMASAKGIECIGVRRRSVPALAWTLLALAFDAPGQSASSAGLGVVANANVPAFTVDRLQRLYTGRAVEVDGVPITAVHLAGAEKARFLEAVVQQSEADYRAYWTVRRHIGKGTPPRDLPTPSALIEFVRSTPGAVGYVSSADARQLPAGVKLLANL